MAEMETAMAFRREVILWMIVAVALLLFVSNFGFGGVVGRFVSSVLFGVFGLVAYVLPVLLLVGSFFAVSNRGSMLAAVKLIAAAFFILFICTFLALVCGGQELMKPLEAYWYCADKMPGGGLVGGLIAYYMAQAFGTVGSYIITVIALIICTVLITGHSALRGLQRGGQSVYESARVGNERYREYRQQQKVRRMDRKASGVSSNTRIEKQKDEKSDEMGEIHIDGSGILPEVKDEKSVALSTIEEVQPVLSGNFIPETDPAVEEAIAEEPTVTQRTRKKAQARTEEELQQEVRQVEQEIAQAKPPVRKYVFPPVELLNKPTGRKSGNTEAHLRETANKLQTTLKTFGVNVTVTNISCGPAVTRYEIQPEMGVKVSKIVGLADDIKLNLAAADIRMEAPIPGKAAIGIEVPNPENVTVSFRELVESKEFKQSKSKLTFAVGKDISGKTMVADIAKMPHLLIAGATGSGKSVCINTIIMSILYKADPQEVKLLMIDPKVVELSVYNGIPHLMIPVVTDPKKASGALQWAVTEMTDRYEKFAQANVREINGYNAKVDQIEVPEGQERPQKMPQIVIIVDELADLMMVASNDIEESICRLAQLARAAGIHLVIATQRPSVNVITGLIKANMPSRIAFAVTSGVDSRTILDMNGAEKLLGKGDMLFNPQGIPKPLRVQGAFVSDEEVSNIVEYIKQENGSAEYSDSVQEKVESLQASGNTTVSILDADESDDGRDAYFKEAGQIIVDKEKASIGMLQRYLKIGFNRAARIMDQLQEAGVVGPEEGTKPRKVLMSPEEFESYLSENV
jgi:S-DNA-T family DNA segregation ATPase FtsK/SpoIIIE